MASLLLYSIVLYIIVTLGHTFLSSLFFLKNDLPHIQNLYSCRNIIQRQRSATVFLLIVDLRNDNGSDPVRVGRNCWLLFVGTKSSLDFLNF